MHDPLNHLRSIRYHWETSDIPCSPNQFLAWNSFAASYSKTALIFETFLPKVSLHKHHFFSMHKGSLLLYVVCIGWVQLDIPLGIYCNCSQVSWSYLQSLRKLYQQTPLDQNQTTVGIPDHKTWPIILIFYIDWYIFQYLHKLATFWTLTYGWLIRWYEFRFLILFSYLIITSFQGLIHKRFCIRIRNVVKFLSY